MNVAIISALDSSGLIGIECEGRYTIPWSLPADMARFKQLTTGQTVVMGRKTWESLPLRPLSSPPHSAHSADPPPTRRRGDGTRRLPERNNIVLSRDVSYYDHLPPHVFHALGLDDVVDIADRFGTEELFVMGGAEVYNLFLPLADNLYLTRIHATVIPSSAERGIYMPYVDLSEWDLKERERFSGENFNYSFEEWVKKGEVEKGSEN